MSFFTMLMTIYYLVYFGHCTSSVILSYINEKSLFESVSFIILVKGILYSTFDYHIRNYALVKKKIKIHYYNYILSLKVTGND